MPRGERDALAGVSSTDSPYAVAPLLFDELPDRIVRATNFEGPDRLQCLELEEDLGRGGKTGRRGQFQTDQRRADDQIVDTARGGLNVGERNLTHTKRAC